MDNLLSFQTKTEECTLGKLIMSPSEQVIAGMTTPVPSLSSQQLGSSSPATSPSQQQKRRSPFLVRGQSKKGKEPQSPASSVTSKMFQVGSMDSINTQESATGSVSSNVLQFVSMDTDGGGGGGEATQQDSLTSMESGLQLRVSTESRDGSLTKELASAIPRVSPTSSDVLLSDQPENEQLEELDSAGKSRYGAGPSSVQSDLAETSQDKTRSVEGGSTVAPPSVEVAMDTEESLPVGNVATSEQVALNFDEVASGAESSEQQEDADETLCSLEGMGGYGGGVVYEGVEVGGGAGSIMNADSSLALDMDKVTQMQEQTGEEPFSPILPTTSLEVGVEEVEQGVEMAAAMVNVQEVGVVEQHGEDMEDGIPAAKLSHQNSMQSERYHR